MENLFYLSFVIRDGECAFEINEDGEPIVSTWNTPVPPDCVVRTLLVRCEQPTIEDRAAGVHARQIVMEFDMATWKVWPLICLSPRTELMCYPARHRSLEHHRVQDSPAPPCQDQDWRQMVWLGVQFVEHIIVCYIIHSANLVYCTAKVISQRWFLFLLHIHRSLYVHVRSIIECNDTLACKCLGIQLSKWMWVSAMSRYKQKTKRDILLEHLNNRNDSRCKLA